ncbi:MAG: GntR family transcriptional regulator [Sphaerochaetaceae bacterium]|nr:GntR family transcriptional regulator [Sphaerochaetaceae bacterium]
MIEELQSIRFSLETTSGIPFYKQIIHQVEMGITDGRLQPGMKLPTVRSLAVELRINPNTVARAYNEMEIRNLVETQQGSGTFVKSQQEDIDQMKRERILSEITRTYISHASSYGFTLEEISSHIHDLLLEKQLPKGGKK